MQIPWQLGQPVLPTSTSRNINVKYSRGEELQHEVGFYSLPSVFGTAGEVILWFSVVFNIMMM